MPGTVFIACGSDVCKQPVKHIGLARVTLSCQPEYFNTLVPRSGAVAVPSFCRASGSLVVSWTFVSFHAAVSCLSFCVASDSCVWHIAVNLDNYEDVLNSQSRSIRHLELRQNAYVVKRPKIRKDTQ